MQAVNQVQTNRKHSYIPGFQMLDDLESTDELSLYQAANDPLLVGHVFEYYRDTLLRTPRALRYLRQVRGLSDPDVITAFRIGFCDRTMGLRLPGARSAEGGAIRGHLQRTGVLWPSGHERFRGSLVFPVFDDQGRIANAYGRKITPRLRIGTAYHVTLANESIGLCNQPALSCSEEVILCKSPLEAATLWSAKLRNVVATMGLRGFSEGHLEAFAGQGVKRVYIAFDNTPAGDQAARLVAQALAVNDIECRRVLFPIGMDANAFARANRLPSAGFAALLRTARPFNQSYEAIMRSMPCG